MLAAASDAIIIGLGVRPLVDARRMAESGLADLEDWERIAERRASELLRTEEPGQALKLLRERDERSPESALHALEARGPSAAREWDAAIAGLRAAIAQAIEQGKRFHALRLSLDEADLIALSGRHAGAVGTATRLDH